MAHILDRSGLFIVQWMSKKIAIINQERIILLIQNNEGKFNLQLARFVPLLFISLTGGSSEIRAELLLEEEGIDWVEIKGHRSVVIVNWSRTRQCFNQQLSWKTNQEAWRASLPFSTTTIQSDLLFCGLQFISVFNDETIYLCKRNVKCSCSKAAHSMKQLASNESSKKIENKL